RGGRRRRGGSEEGLAGSIGDEFTANAPPEASDAVADLDSFDRQAAPSIAQVEHTAEPQVTQPEPHAEVQAEAPAQPEPAPAAAAPVAEEEPADDKIARRRSTVREKVSFLSSSQPEPAAPLAQATEPVAPPPPAPEPAPEAASETPAAPRRAGWWSRRFGGGQ
ncbi:ribonuclease, partial [Bradyrhizobium sp. NAS80.1]